MIFGNDYQPYNGLNGLSGINGLTGMGKKPAPTPAPAPTTVQLPPIKPITLPPAQQTGWGGPQGGMSMSDILNGPQFGSGAPVAGQVPPPAGATPPQGQMAPPPQQPPLVPATMPSPQVPQQNFNQFGQDLMARILHPNGGA